MVGLYLPEYIVVFGIGIFVLLIWFCLRNVIEKTGWPNKIRRFCHRFYRRVCDWAERKNEEEMKRRK